MKETKNQESFYEEMSNSSTWSDTQVLAENVETEFACVNYIWRLQYVILSTPETTQMQVFVNWASRYNFVDKVSLKIRVKAKDSWKLIERFEIKKLENQHFIVDLKTAGFRSGEDLKVSCTMIVTNVKYYSDSIGTVNLFTNANRPHDVALAVGGKKFYVHKAYLGTWSKFFDKLFTGDFSEKDQKEIKLEDVDPGEFQTLLAIIHPEMGTEVDDSNVIYLLKLADRFEMPSVMVMCGNHLRDFENCPEITLMERLEMSEQYNLTHLQIACFENYHQMNPADLSDFHENNRNRLKKLGHNILQNLV